MHSIIESSKYFAHFLTSPVNTTKISPLQN